MVAFLRIYDAISCLWGEHELDGADDCLGFRRLGYDGRRGPPRETDQLWHSGKEDEGHIALA